MKAIRLSEEDERLVQEFLERNPIFDFSSLTRTALLTFIENPRLDLTPVKAQKITAKEDGRGRPARTLKS